MPRGHPHPPEVKAAVIADMVTGMSASAAARKHGVSASRAMEWGRQAGTVAIIEHKKAISFGDSLADALTKSIAALAAIADHAGDKAWLNGQSAHDLAILYGVFADKSVRILQAAEPADGYLVSDAAVADMAE